jgi:exodeoxyribonuclease VII small subunit
MTFEQSTRRVEEIVAQLEDGELDLASAMQLFEEGVGALRAASADLDAADGALRELVENADGSFSLLERD